MEEVDNMRFVKSSVFLVAHGFEASVDPDGSVDGKTLFIQGFEIYWTGTRLDHNLKASDTHEEGLLKL